MEHFAQSLADVRFQIHCVHKQADAVRKEKPISNDATPPPPASDVFDRFSSWMCFEVLHTLTSV
jgi:hypothetical protein